MSVSFIRIDDRMIHGQTCTRWAREYPCDGLVAVNDKAANNSVLKAAYKSAIVGPCNDREGATKLGNNQSITQEEAEAFEALAKAGYTIKFALLPDVSIGTWDDFKDKFGF